MTFAFDSDTISYMLKNDKSVLSHYRQEEQSGHEFIIPAAVFYEIRRGLLAKKLDSRLVLFDNLCEAVKYGDFSKAVWQKAAEIYASLRQQGKPIGDDKDSDILIGAYCIIKDYTLVTNNI